MDEIVDVGDVVPDADVVVVDDAPPVDELVVGDDVVVFVVFVDDDVVDDVLAYGIAIDNAFVVDNAIVVDEDDVVVVDDDDELVFDATVTPDGSAMTTVFASELFTKFGSIADVVMAVAVTL